MVLENTADYDYDPCHTHDASMRCTEHVQPHRILVNEAL